MAQHSAHVREYLRVRKLIRRYLGVSGCAYPIESVDGWDAPHMTGKSWCYRTPGGGKVYYPNAYRRAFGRPVYWASTCCIIVGRSWVNTRAKLLDTTPDHIIDDYISQEEQAYHGWQDPKLMSDLVDWQDANGATPRREANCVEHNPI